MMPRLGGVGGTPDFEPDRSRFCAQTVCYGPIHHTSFTRPLPGREDFIPTYSCYVCLLSAQRRFPTMDKIIFQASRLRRVPCTIIEPPLEGGSHTVYKITFDDSVEWVVRTNKVKGNSEIDTRAAKKLRYIRKIKPDIKVPEVYIDGGIIFTEWMAGEPLRVWNFQIALARRHTFLDGLAEVLLQLWTTPTAEGSASGTTGLYSTWLITSLDRALRRTLLGTARWGDAIDYLIMRSMIPAYSDAVDQYSTLGFAHGDLNAHNLIRTENFQLAG